MKRKQLGMAICGLAGVGLFLPGALFSQAGPGPMSLPTSNVPSAPARPVAPRPQPREVIARTNLAGSWRFNRDQSDDPQSKARETMPNSTGNNYPGGGYPGGGYPGGGYPGGGYPGTGYPRRSPGGGYPGGGYPGGGYPNGGRQPDFENNEKIQELIRPANSLTFAIRTSDIEVTDEHFDKIDFMIDGRQAPKKQEVNNQLIAAHWDGHELVSDEKSPLGGKMSRTFELSSDGKQAYETWRIERGRSAPLVVRYVYDANDPASAQRSSDSDSDKPVLRRSSSEGAGSSSEPAASPVQQPAPGDASASGPSGNSTATQPAPPPQPEPAPAAAPPAANQTPDPDAPVLRKRTK